MFIEILIQCLVIHRLSACPLHLELNTCLSYTVLLGLRYSKATEMLIMNAEGIVEKGAMAVKVDSIVAVNFYFLFFEVRQVMELKQRT